MEKNFCRVYCAKDLVIILALSIGGIILVSIPTPVSVNILGFFMLLTGILLGIFMKSGYKDAETGVRYYKTEHFFPAKKREILAEAIGGNLRKLDLADENTGNSLRMDVYYSPKSGKAYIQIFEYIPYKYEPYTMMHEHSIECANKLINKKLTQH